MGLGKLAELNRDKAPNGEHRREKKESHRGGRPALVDKIQVSQHTQGKGLYGTSKKSQQETTIRLAFYVKRPSGARAHLDLACLAIAARECVFPVHHYHRHRLVRHTLQELADHTAPAHTAPKAARSEPRRRR